MGILKGFFKDTAIYGMATVVPRLMTFILAPLQIGALSTASYSENTTFYIWAAFFNVILTFGMETSFFRYFSRADKKQDVFSTSFIALTFSTIAFFLFVMLFRDRVITIVDLPPNFFNILLGVLVLDNLVVIPFAYLRATNRPIKFTLIKVINVLILTIINVLYLFLIPNYPNLFPEFILSTYHPNNLVQYIFWANLVASAVTFLMLLPYFFQTNLVFKWSIFISLWQYGWPVMVAGVAFVINEMFDKLIMKDLISDDIMGAYAGVYKLAIFMALYIQAFRLGAEPFFFNQYKKENSRQIYAEILKYFVLAGSAMLLVLVVFIDFLKLLIVPNEDYWVTIAIVPIILLANLCLGIYHNLSIWYKLTDKTKIGMYISLVGAFLTVILNLMLVPVYGFMAAAWATLAAYASMMLISFYLGQRYFPVPYDVNRIGAYLLLSAGLSAVSFLLFRNNYYIGIILILIFFAMVLLSEKDQLKQLFRRS